jgi:N-acetylmuramoyl-L-alanine amidase
MLNDKKMIPCFDSGHGGMVIGTYATPGKRSPDWDKGILYEGAFNRWIKHGLMEMCDLESIPYLDASPGYFDTALHERTAVANFASKHNKDLYLFSIHANAGGGTGTEIFTSVGATQSDPIATMFFNDIAEEFPGRKMRSDFADGDADKEALFFVLTKTICPAVLLEVGFMDNKADYNELWDPVFRQRMCNAMFKTIKRLYV